MYGIKMIELSIHPDGSRRLDRLAEDAKELEPCAPTALQVHRHSASQRMVGNLIHMMDIQADCTDRRSC